LCEGSGDRNAGGIGQTIELEQMLVEVVSRVGALEGSAYEKGALYRGCEIDQVARNGVSGRK
jgi:hypothetical protein